MATQFELEGIVRVILDVQTFASGFEKREFVVEVEDGRFPQMIKFETVRDKIAQLEGLALGDKVKVAFDVRGNEYQGRYFVNLNAWKIEKANGNQGGTAAPSPQSDSQWPISEPPGGYGQENDDIPF